MIEEHPLEPFLPKNATVLMLGSFPPKQEKWSMSFYYPNFQNDMWRIIGLLFFTNKTHFIDCTQKCFTKDAIIDFLYAQGIAMGDSGKRIRRLHNNASDKFLEVIEALNIRDVLKELPQCQHIITTGEKSLEVLMQSIGSKVAPSIGSPLQYQIVDNIYTVHRLPSSSRAYPLSIEKKAQLYKNVFDSIFSNEIL